MLFDLAFQMKCKYGPLSKQFEVYPPPRHTHKHKDILSIIKPGEESSLVICLSHLKYNVAH